MIENIKDFEALCIAKEQEEAGTAEALRVQKEQIVPFGRAELSEQEEAAVIALINFASVILFPAGRLLYRGKKGRRRRWKGEKRRKGEGENSKGRRGEDGKVRR